MRKRLFAALRAIHARKRERRWGRDSTRREVLIGGSAALATGQAFAQSVEQPVQLTPDGAVIHAGDRVWTIDLGDFAPGARRKLTPEADGSGFTLEVLDARWPGVGYDASFALHLKKAENGWRVGMRPRAMPGPVEFKPLADWLNGAVQLQTEMPTRAELQALDLVVRDAARLTYGADGRWRLEPAGASDRLDITAAGQRVAAHRILISQERPGTSVVLKPFADRFPGPATLLAAEGLSGMPAGAWKSVFAGGETLSITFKSHTAFEIHALEAGAQRAALNLVQAAAIANVGMGAGETCRLHFDQLTLLSGPKISGGVDVLHGDLSKRPRALAIGDALAMIRGGAAPVDWLFTAGRKPAFRVLADLSSVEIPMRGADKASLIFPEPRAVWIARQRPTPTRAEASAAGEAALLWFSGKRQLTLRMEGSRLHTLRARDLLDLQFELRGFDLGVDRETTFRPRGANSSTGAPNSQRRLVVHFPAQHILEKATAFQNGKPAEPPPVLVQARMANGSRLSFAIPDDDTALPWTPDLARLLDWKRWDLAVHPRALNASAPLTEQMALTGIGRFTSRSSALVKIGQTLGEPHPAETAIESTYRLILSPSARSRWILPPDRAAAEPQELWHARLDPERGGRDVRAIWSRDMELGFLRGEPREGTEDDPSIPAAISAEQRQDLVVLSSAYGLPALRRELKNPAEGTPGPVPLNGWKYLGSDEGVYVPRPLDQAEIVLTALGGTFIAKGAWEPPQIGADPRRWRPPNVEGWEHKAYLGRDTYVKVAEKGYLFPFGHRATFITQTERRFWAHPETGEPVAYLFQRRFITVGRPRKSYPGPSQPFGGREFPAAELEMLTRQTLDLVEPKMIAGAKAFWPQVTVDGPPLPFRMQVERQAGEMIGPLLFVFHEAAGSPTAMKAIVEHYHDKAQARLRVFNHNGARRSYAPSRKAGDTEFRTSTWTLRARGPLKAGDARGQGESDYVITPVMNGQDQPPFYPVLDRAKVRLQSVEDLVDQRLGDVGVRPNTLYVENAFDKVSNSSELYLEVLDPVHLDFSRNGTAGSGLAHTNSRIASLSRVVGPVGGRGASSGGGARGLAEAAAAADGAFNPSVSAEAGQFDPLEFFGGALNEAKLLGLVSLGDIIRPALMKNAPRLVEKIDYGAGEALDAVILGIRSILAAFEAEAEQAAGELGLGQQGLAGLYPDLARSVRRLDETLAQVEALPGAAKLPQIGKVRAGVEALTRGLAAVRDDPTPAPAREMLEQLQRTWRDVIQFKDLLPQAGLTRLVEEAFQRPLKAALKDLCLSLGGEGGALRVLLGADPGQTCAVGSGDDLIALAGRAQTSVFYEAYGRRLTQLQSEIEGLGSDVEAAFELRADALANALVSLASRALDYATSAILLARTASGLDDVTADAKRLCDAAQATARGWAKDAAGGSSELSRSLVAIERAWRKISLPTKPATLGEELRRLQTVGSQKLQTLATDLIAYEKLAGDQMASLDCRVGKLDPLSEIFRRRLAAMRGWRDLASIAGQLIETAGQRATEAELQKLKSELDALIPSFLEAGAVLGGQRAAVTAAGVVAAQFAEGADAEKALRARSALRSAQIRGGLEAVRAAAENLTKRMAAINGDFKRITAYFDAAAVFASDAERHLAGLVAGVGQMDRAASTAIARGAAQISAPAVSVVIKAYDKASGGFTAISDLLDSPNGKILAKLIDPNLRGNLKAAIEAFRLEHDQLKTAAQNLAAGSVAEQDKGLQDLQKLVGAWSGGDCALVRSVRLVDDAVRPILSGQLGRLVDVRAVERLLREELEKLVPARQTIAHEWSTQVSPYPSSQPLFEMDGPSRSAEKADLTLSGAVEIDFLKNRRRFSSKGELQPFNIHVAFSGTHFLSIFFGPATFTSGNSGTKLDVGVRDVAIGNGLRFIQALGSWFSGGGDEGLFYQLHFAPPGVEVGYRTPAMSIDLAPSFAITDVALEISALLPLDNREARFRFAVSSRDRPFLIFFGYYIGGGFVRLTANTRGIVEVDAAFEFGAGTRIAFGPLRATGRVMAGVYIRQSGAGALITGYVYAAGEGNIACFGVSVHIEVSLTHDTSSGSTTGRSSYRLSFKVGWVELSYSFTAEYSVGGSGSSSSGALEGPKAALKVPPAAVLRTVLPDRQTHWADYARKFDLKLLGA